MPPASGNEGQGLVARIAGSAEYSIAAALLAVVVAVIAAFWLLKPQPPVEEIPPEPVAGATAPVVDEDAAVDVWKRRLGEQFGALEEQQRQRAAEEEQARRARQRAEDAAAEARRQTELAAQARQQAEVEARERSFLTGAMPSAATPQPAPASTPTPRALPTPPASVEAAIDWSSCQRPSYPALSVNRGEEGVVVVAVDLDANARILKAEVAGSSGHARLDRVTLEAVRKCRFTPAVENGAPKAARAEVRMTWKLQG